MKIKSLQISNIIRFAHVDDIANAPKVTFDKNLNIVIGQNGAGKSTALEIINFIFRRMNLWDVVTYVALWLAALLFNCSPYA